MIGCNCGTELRRPVLSQLVRCEHFRWKTRVRTIEFILFVCYEQTLTLLGADGMYHEEAFKVSWQQAASLLCDTPAT